MQKIKTKLTKLTHSLLAISLLSLIFYPGNIKATEYTLDDFENQEIWEINQDINERRSEIQELKRQIDIYKKNISAKQRDLYNLSDQVSTLNESIAKINLEIQTTELEVETLELRIENTGLKIQAKEREINDQKEILGETIRQLHREQKKNSVLEILLLNENFSDFMAELDRLESMQNSLVDGVYELKEFKIALEQDKGS